jgi:hypothetical protein
MLMGTYETEVYFMTKNRDILKTSNIVAHAIYRVTEAVIWGIRTKSIKVILYGIMGSIKGFIKSFVE